MKVKIKEQNYTIKKVSNVLMNKEVANTDTQQTFFGLCDYNANTIFLNDDMDKDRIKPTLIHELTHAFIFEFGHKQSEEFNEERVCDLFGAFAEEIMDITDKYLSKIKE